MYLKASQKKIYFNSRKTFYWHWCVFVEKQIQIYTVNNVLKFFSLGCCTCTWKPSEKNQFPGYETQLFDCKLALYTTVINGSKNNNRFTIDTNYL